MNKFMEINEFINKIVWGIPMILFLLGTGIILCFASGFVIYRKFPYIMKNTFFKVFCKEKNASGGITPFQAVSTALAATVGTGNIVGVSLAIVSGGPGAVFWMWISALIGMTTKFAEVTLAVATREINNKGEYVGGPMYYMKNALHMPGLAKMFALSGGLAVFGIGCMVQSNSISTAIYENFHVDPRITGVITAFLAGIVLIGGIKRIGQFAEKIVPLMSILYLTGCIIIIGIHFKEIPEAFGMIFRDAFTGTAAIGGFAGSTVSMAIKSGITRGIFTNEAGMGSASIAHAAANVEHPIIQGMWGTFEVFVDTILVCTVTALVILTSGLWKITCLNGAALTSIAFNQTIIGSGIIVTISLALFAFATMIGWSYYGEKCLEYIFGSSVIIPYRILFIILIGVGSVYEAQMVWKVADTLNGFMAIPNLIALLCLVRPFRKLVKDFKGWH